MFIKIVVENLRQWSQVHNLCDICCSRFHKRQESICLEANRGTPNCAWGWSSWRSSVGSWLLIDWIVTWGSWTHSPCTWWWQHWQKCKSTIGCATRSCPHAQLIASFPWTPAQRAAYSHLLSIHRDVRVGLWNNIWLPARDGPILALTACSFTGTVHTIAASLHESPLAIESLL